MRGSEHVRNHRAARRSPPRLNLTLQLRAHDCWRDAVSEAASTPPCVFGSTSTARVSYASAVSGLGSSANRPAYDGLPTAGSTPQPAAAGLIARLTRRESSRVGPEPQPPALSRPASAACTPTLGRLIGARHAAGHCDAGAGSSLLHGPVAQAQPADPGPNLVRSLDGGRPACSLRHRARRLHRHGVQREGLRAGHAHAAGQAQPALGVAAGGGDGGSQV